MIDGNPGVRASLARSGGEGDQGGCPCPVALNNLLQRGGDSRGKGLTAPV